ncbi:MAG: transporter substrate-binding domain-containing protein [Burkholderiales bacterium]|nr:transporter substrate-binding domain-containing protein [Burkholderiales bacterium]
MKSRFLVAALGLLAAGAACADSLLDRVQSGGPLRVCTTGDYKPYSFAKGDGAYEGIDIDLTNSLARSLDAKVAWVKTSWSTLMADFGAGKCDLAVGGVSVTLERQKKAGFSAAYMIDGKTPITRCENAAKFQTLDQIDRPDVRVVVNPGGTNERFAKAHLKHAQLTVYPDNVTIFQQLVDGKADLMITDASETLLQHKLHPELCSVHPDRPFQYGEKAFLLPRDDEPFRAYVDQWLHLAVATGEFARIRDAWLK